MTATEVASAMATDFKSAEQALEDLCASGVAEMHIDDNGAVVYVFPDVLSPDEKNAAKNLLES